MATRIISLSGGGPWGFTLSGGRDFGSPLAVSKVTPGGKADKGGVKKGDFVVAINGDAIEGLLHFDAQQMIKATGMSLQLKLSSQAPKSPSLSRAHLPPSSEQTSSRPHPTSPPQGGGAIPSSNPREPIKLPYPSGPTVPRSELTVEAGLGSSKTQSPSFKRLHVSGDDPSPSVMSNPPPRPPSPPSEHMKNVQIGKTATKPPPPPVVTTKVTIAPKKESPIAKPTPPRTVTSPKPPSATTSPSPQGLSPQSPTSPSGQQQLTPSVAAKLIERQGVCAACTQPIRGPYATAMGRCWHPEHFVCTSCNRQLQNTMFVFEEEKIFCEGCYEKTYAKTCHSCRRPIVGPCITAQDLSWHQEHFVCSRCGTDLTQGQGFNMEANELFCGDCYGASYGATCQGCGQKIGGDQLWVEALDHQWHPHCFICTMCRNPLEGGSFFAKLGRPYCKNCV